MFGMASPQLAPPPPLPEELDEAVPELEPPELELELEPVLVPPPVSSDDEQARVSDIATAMHESGRV